MDDQAFYDTLFRMAGALVFLAREARQERQARMDVTMRALRLEARARYLEIERDYWRAREERAKAYRHGT